MLKQGQLLAGALAAAAVTFSGIAAAEATGSVYGDIRYGFSYLNTKKDGFPGEHDLHDSYSYLGVKASTKVGGVSAFGVYEREIDTDDSCNLAHDGNTFNATCFGGLGTGSSSTTITTHKDYVRQAYAGVTGGFGTVAYGQMETDYSKMSRRFDPFYNTGVSGSLFLPAGALSVGGSHGGSLFALPLHTLGFVNNQLTYTTPSLGGLSVNLGYFSNEDGGATKATDDPDYAAGVDFSMGGLMVGAQHLRVRSVAASTAPNFLALGATLDATTLSAGYNGGNFGAGLMAERLDFAGGGAHIDSAQLSGWFGVMQNTRVAVLLGYNNEAFEGRSVTVGVFHDIVPNFTTHVALTDIDGKGGNPDLQAFTLGASYKFDLGVVGGK